MLLDEIAEFAKSHCLKLCCYRFFEDRTCLPFHALPTAIAEFGLVLRVFCAGRCSGFSAARAVACSVAWLN